MRWQQIVELSGTGGRGAHGSGYLLAPGLVLTARHVVGQAKAASVRLLTPDEDGLPGGVGAWQDARVAWTGASRDLALLVPQAGAATFREVATPVAIARLDGREPVRVDALGFPRALQTPTHSDTLHLQAMVDPWSAVRSDVLLLDVRTARPAEDDGWKGMSGAAVFGGDRLVGVVEAVPLRLDDSTLRATPAHVLFADTDARALLQAAGIGDTQQMIDASYVERLPPGGHWGGLRERYARAVVTQLLRIDHVGLAVGGAADRRMPALAAFGARRLTLWPANASATGVRLPKLAGLL